MYHRTTFTYVWIVKTHEKPPQRSRDSTLSDVCNTYLKDRYHKHFSSRYIIWKPIPLQREMGKMIELNEYTLHLKCHHYL